MPLNPDIDDVRYESGGEGIVTVTTGQLQFIASVSLPHNAVVTAVIVYGNAGSEDETWSLILNPHASTTSTFMAQAVINTEDTTITSATIDNSANRYHISIATGLNTNDEIFGARITYTTDYD